MRWIGHIGLRQRFLWIYVVLVCAAAVVEWWVWPGYWPAIAVMLGASIATAWVVARWLTWALRRRVRALREMTEAMSRGDLDQRLSVLARDDFVKLAESLDRMCKQLRDTVREHRELQEKLTRSEKLALIGELAAGVAHEINNPLDGLQNSTEIIRRNLAGIERSDQAAIVQTRQLLDLMESGLYRIEMIVRKLLTMARDEPIHAVPTRLDEVVQDAVQFVRPRLERNGVEFVSDYPADPVFAQADRGQLAQVLINLFINAADAMPDGGRLTVRCLSDPQDGRAVLEVADTGHGIPAEHLPHIFEPFYTTKESGSGTGLGLAVAARIVEAHGGTIEAASEPGRGTRFCIELPGAGQSMEREQSDARDQSVFGYRHRNVLQ
jgi:signal transduction histidine kinase